MVFHLSEEPADLLLTELPYNIKKQHNNQYFGIYALHMDKCFRRNSIHARVLLNTCLIHLVLFLSLVHGTSLSPALCFERPALLSEGEKKNFHYIRYFVDIFLIVMI